jgi:hypothetical protein
VRIVPGRGGTQGSRAQIVSQRTHEAERVNNQERVVEELKSTRTRDTAPVNEALK